MTNIKFLALTLFLTLPFALVGVWYISTGGIIYFVKVKPLTPIEGDTITSIETNNKPVSLKFRSLSTSNKEGLLSSNPDRPTGLDPNFDANAALERLEYLKNQGDFTNRAVFKEIAELITSLRRYEENGGTYR